MPFLVKTIERNIEKKLLFLLKKRQWCRSSKRRFIVLNDPLTAAQKNEIKKFFKPYIYLHSTIDHSFYTACTGEYRREYIPDWVHYVLIDPYFNNWGGEAQLVDNKCYYQMMFPDCKQPYSILYRMNNIWFSHDRKVVRSSNIENVLDSEEGFLFVKQATESCGGHGVKRTKGRKETLAAIESFSGDIVVQREIKQSKVTQKLNSTSVNTIRILSLLSEEGVKVYSMIVRCGVDGSFVDNASSGGVTIGIGTEGQLKPIGYDKNGKRYNVHPTSGVVFSDIVVPNINGCISLVKRLHPLVPDFRMISWDIALDTNNEPLLIEANLKDGELDFHQLNNGPLFGDDTHKILKEVFLSD